MFRTWPVRIIAVVLATAVVGAFGYTRLAAAPPKQDVRTATVQRGSITQTVSITGAVNPTAQVRLNFKAGGRLAEVNVAIGSLVTAGQPLARLDTTDLEVALRQAQANLLSAQAKYDQVLAGASPEDIAAARQAVENAQRSLETTQRTTQTDLTTSQQSLYRLRTGYFAAKQTFIAQVLGVQSDTGTIQSSVDQSKAQSTQALVTLAALVSYLTDSPDQAPVKTARSQIAQADGSLANAQNIVANQLKPALLEYATTYDALLSVLTNFEVAVNGDGDVASLTAPYQTAQAAYRSAQARLAVAVEALSAQVQSAQSSTNSAQATLAGVRTGLESARADLNALASAMLDTTQSVSLARSRLNQATLALDTITEAAGGGYVMAQQGLSTAQDKGSASVVSAQNALAAAQASLQKTSASARSFDIAAAQANVLIAQAQVETAQNNLANATLTAPTAGVIAAVNSQPGEFVSGGGSSGSSTSSSFIVLASTGALTLHGTVGEADVVKLRVGQVATLTLDAIGADKRLTGKVVSLDPVATLQQGVPVYGIDVALDLNDPVIRPGMTGTANVLVASKQNVLVVPNIAIRNLGGRRGVQVLRNGEAVDVTDVTFGLANEQVTEVTGGLSQGDQVLLPAARAGPTPQFRGPGAPGLGPGPGR